jgi:PDZ domain-containing protein
VVRTDTLSQLAEALTAAKPGDVARLTVTSLDSDDERTADVELVADPEEGRTLIGFIARDTRTVDLPFDIEIDTDRIGGPSAGLSFTLALIDALTKGELTPDGGVAVTGTIADDGSVGAIGLLLQKAIAVRQSGVEYFLVPASQSKEEIDEARRVVGDDVEIIAVATLEEALNALKRLGGSPITLDR